MSKNPIIIQATYQKQTKLEMPQMESETSKDKMTVTQQYANSRSLAMIRV